MQATPQNQFRPFTLTVGLMVLTVIAISAHSSNHRNVRSYKCGNACPNCSGGHCKRKGEHERCKCSSCGHSW